MAPGSAPTPEREPPAEAEQHDARERLERAARPRARQDDATSIEQEREPHEPHDPLDEVDSREEERLRQRGIARADELGEEGEVEHGDLRVQDVVRHALHERVAEPKRRDALAPRGAGLGGAGPRTPPVAAADRAANRPHPPPPPADRRPPPRGEKKRDPREPD